MTTAFVGTSSVDVVDETLSVLFFLLDVFQIVVLSRLMLVALLGERNEVLSANIREKCEEQKGTEKTVIAILGAAHLNGVQNRLLYSKKNLIFFFY